TRVGHKTNYDKLTLKIKTNGAVTPDFALSQTAKTFSDYMKVLMDVTDIALFESFIKEEEKPKEREEIPIEELNLSVRSYNCLKKESIVYISNLCDYTEQQLLSIRNLGMKSLNEIKKKLEERKLTLKKV
ncbi:MAG: DNA-directed RNA polymerase subunit alpha, partial [Actinobacteria bacterium]|nr:DNA-directed RNA polymerase subunit alpha [Actinomycetota bacterium]